MVGRAGGAGLTERTANPEAAEATVRGQLDRLARLTAVAKQMAAKGITPKRVSRRLLEVAWWGLFENAFFVGTPSAGSFALQEDSRLVLVDLGDCDVVSGKRRRLLHKALRCLADDNISDAASSLTELIAPLPFIDTEGFTKQLETRLAAHLFAMRNPSSPWWQRTSGGLWLALLDVAYTYKVSIRLDVLRMMRTALLYDQRAAQAWPKLDLLDEFERYRWRARKRLARIGCKQLSEGGTQTRQDTTRALIRNWDALENALDWVDNIVDEVPLQFTLLSKKSAYTVAVTLQAGLAILTVTMLTLSVYAAWRLFSGLPLDPTSLVMEVLSNYLYLGVVLVIFVTCLRRILFRLDDLERH